MINFIFVYLHYNTTIYLIGLFRGMEAVLLDYVRADNFGQTITKSLHWILLAITGATLSGLFYFIYNDIGLTKSIRKIWMLKPKTNNIEAIVVN